MKFIMAQILGVICSILSISVTQFKSLKHILIGELAMNLLFAANYLLLDGISGALVCAFAALHAVVVYVYNNKEKKMPVLITALFILIYSAVALVPLALNIASSDVTLLYVIKSVLPLISSLLFTFAIGQRKTIGYRLIKSTNTVMWLIFDLCVSSYGSLISRFLNLASHGIAILRHDVKKQN